MIYLSLFAAVSDAAEDVPFSGAEDPGKDKSSKGKADGDNVEQLGNKVALFLLLCEEHPPIMHSAVLAVLLTLLGPFLFPNSTPVMLLGASFPTAAHTGDASQPGNTQEVVARQYDYSR